jgi:choline dehydrogenase-like flavoprotein
MIVDGNNIENGSDVLVADIVIVGAGTVGLFCANYLVKKGRSVLIIEAGSHIAVTLHNADTAESIGKPHNGVETGRAVGLGGTSALWGGQLAEFEESDLRRPGYQWPLDYKELCEWYETTYDLLGLAKQRKVKDYQNAFGIVSQPHPAIEQFFTYWLPQPNFAVLFKRFLRDDTRVRVLLNATANDVRFEGAQAIQLRISTSAGRQLAANGKAFVFAAGTIANAQFFLTTQRQSSVPWRSNQFVGKYFQDHLGAKVADVELFDERRFRMFFENGFAHGRKLQPKLRFTRTIQSELATGVSGAFSFSSSSATHVAQVKTLIKGLKSGLSYSGLRTLPVDLMAIGRSFAPLVVRYVNDRRIMAFLDQGVELHVQAEQWPIRESEIRLLEDKPGKNGLIRVGVDWQIDGREIESIRQFTREADSFIQQQGLARLRDVPSLWEHDGGFLTRLSDTYHQCGGLRMSSSPSDGVTDRDCRVWDTKNVFVAGTSVLPTSGCANSTLTGLAIGARLAEQLSALQTGLGT